MMIKDYKHLMELLHMHMVKMLLKYVKVKWQLKRKIYLLNCITTKYKMINFDEYTNENKLKHNLD